jgi:hypothetical protein
MSIASLSLPQSHPTDNWDRPPQPGLPTEIQRLEGRRSALVRQLRGALGRKTLGTDRRIIERADRVAELVNQYHAVGLTILQLELL